MAESAALRVDEALAEQPKLLMVEPIPQLDDEIGTRARSAGVGNTLRFANIPGIFNKNSGLNIRASGVLPALSWIASKAMEEGG